MKKLIVLATVALGLAAQPALAVIETGPTESLQIETWYHNTTSSVVFIEFKGSVAMPGCYAGSGGYLHYTEPNFDRLYAVFLTILARGSMRGAVLFEKTGQPASEWPACDIKGLVLYPE